MKPGVKIDDEPRTPEENNDISIGKKISFFISIYWRGLIIIFAPLLLMPVVVGNNVQNWQWCAFTLFVMIIFWVSECIPMPVTSFLPMVVFPLTGIMSTEKTCLCYLNDTVIMFLGSIMLAFAVEQSGLHIRLAYNAVKLVGFSRRKQLLGISFVTMFVSMWITNTAATSMMVPITFALLKIFENQNLGKIFEVTSDGVEYASKLTACYFCAITFSATIGGIGTLVGTATNLVHKGLFQRAFPNAPEYLTFIRYSMFAAPYMLVLEIMLYISLLITHMGLFRPNSKDAKMSSAPQEVILTAKEQVNDALRKLGPITFHELMVVFLFLLAILMFTLRYSPDIGGWSIVLLNIFGVFKDNEKYVRDSVPAIFVAFIMLILPSTLLFFKYFSGKNNVVPTKRIPSILEWDPTNKAMPYSFMFLLGAGFSLSEAAKAENTNLNGVIAEAMRTIKDLPVPLTLFIIIFATVTITNFASNVVVCNVLTPIAMELAIVQKVNPVWYAIASGFSASYCFCLPVGTPGNLIAQVAAKIRTKDMIYCGFGITIFGIIATWIFMYFYAPVIFADLHSVPSWVTSTT